MDEHRCVTYKDLGPTVYEQRREIFLQLRSCPTCKKVLADFFAAHLNTKERAAFGRLYIAVFDELPEQVVPHSEIPELLESIKEVFDVLTYREMEVLNLLYAFDGNYAYTVKEISRIFRATEKAIFDAEANAIRKLQKPVPLRRLKHLITGR